MRTWIVKLYGRGLNIKKAFSNVEYYDILKNAMSQFYGMQIFISSGMTSLLIIRL